MSLLKKQSNLETVFILLHRLPLVKEFGNYFQINKNTGVNPVLFFKELYYLFLIFFCFVGCVPQTLKEMGFSPKSPSYLYG